MANIYSYENIVVKAISFSADYRELNEVSLHLSMKHDNIVEAYGLMSENELKSKRMHGSLGLMLEKYEHSLWDHVPSDSKTMMLQVAYGLKYMHDNNLVHCDLSPKNVLIKNNKAAITDFELSTFVGLKHLANWVTVKNSHLPVHDLKESPIVRKSYDIWSLALLFTYIYEYKGVYEKLMHRNYAEHVTILTTNGELNDLLKQMLKYNASKRININGVINHKFFDDIRGKIDYLSGNCIEKCMGNSHIFIKSRMCESILQA